MTAHLERVLGAVARLLHVNHLQDARVLDLLQHDFIIKVKVLLQKQNIFPLSDEPC